MIRQTFAFSRTVGRHLLILKGFEANCTPHPLPAFSGLCRLERRSEAGRAVIGAGLLRYLRFPVLRLRLDLEAFVVEVALGCMLPHILEQQHPGLHIRLAAGRQP